MPRLFGCAPRDTTGAIHIQHGFCEERVKDIQPLQTFVCWVRDNDHVKSQVKGSMYAWYIGIKGGGDVKSKGTRLVIEKEKGNRPILAACRHA